MMEKATYLSDEGEEDAIHHAQPTAHGQSADVASQVKDEPGLAERGGGGVADGGEGAGEEGDDAEGCGGEVGEGLAEDGHGVGMRRAERGKPFPSASMEMKKDDGERIASWIAGRGVVRPVQPVAGRPSQCSETARASDASSSGALRMAPQTHLHISLGRHGIILAQGDALNRQATRLHPAVPQMMSPNHSSSRHPMAYPPVRRSEGQRIHARYAHFQTPVSPDCPAKKRVGKLAKKGYVTPALFPKQMESEGLATAREEEALALVNRSDSLLSSTQLMVSPDL